MSTRVSFDNNKKYMENSNFNPDHSSRKPAAAPIDIPSPGNQERLAHRRRNRHRRDSEASSSLSSLSETFSSDSPSPTTPPPDSLPAHDDGVSPEIATSPLMSYFMAHASPIKSASARQYSSFRDNKPKPATSPGANIILDDVDGLPHVLHHARRMSHNWDQTKTIGIAQKLPPTESQQERGASLMRRLSLSGAAQRPSTQSLSRSIESRSALSPVPDPPVATPPRRSATISQTTSPIRRPPSPMGERMLKGDFHGF